MTGSTADAWRRACRQADPQTVERPDDYERAVIPRQLVAEHEQGRADDYEEQGREWRAAARYGAAKRLAAAINDDIERDAS